MSGGDLKKWMKENNKTVIDVSSMTKVHPQTIQRFLDGKRSHPSTQEAFRRLIADGRNTITGGQKAAGT